MLPMKKEKEFTISVTVGAIVNFVLNLILIFKLKALGTTIASVAAEFAVTLIQLYFLRDIIKLSEIMKTVYKPLLGALTMALVVWISGNYLPFNLFGTLAEVIIGIITYVVSMLILKDETIKEVMNQVIVKFLKKGV